MRLGVATPVCRNRAFCVMITDRRPYGVGVGRSGVEVSVGGRGVCVSVGGLGLGVGVLIGGLGPPLPGVLVNVGPITNVGVRVGVMSRRVADGVGVDVAEVVAVALGVKVAVAVFVGVSVGVAVGVGVTVFVGSTTGATLVAVLVGVRVGVGSKPGPTTANPVAHRTSKISRPAAILSIRRRLFLRRTASNSAAGNWLVSTGLAIGRTRAILKADRISLALAKRLAMGTSMARKITRSISGEMEGLISRSVRNAPGLETRRVTVVGGSPVNR